MKLKGKMKFKIIHEEEQFLVIDKPAGIRVDKDPKGQEESIEANLDYNVERNGIVHRIDKQTSGLLLIAKTSQALENFKQQFKKHQVIKKYYLLVLGETPEEGEIITYLARDPKRKQSMKVILYPTGSERGDLREAETHFKTKKHFTYDKKPLSLLVSQIKTGRTHQIRAHFHFRGHPLIGDQMYNTKESKRLSKKLNLDRQFLHAFYLELNHPQKNEKISFESDLPTDLENVLNMLK